MVRKMNLILVVEKYYLFAQCCCWTALQRENWQWNCHSSSRCPRGDAVPLRCTRNIQHSKRLRTLSASTAQKAKIVLDTNCERRRIINELSNRMKWCGKRQQSRMAKEIEVGKRTLKMVFCVWACVCVCGCMREFYLWISFDDVIFDVAAVALASIFHFALSVLRKNVPVITLCSVNHRPMALPSFNSIFEYFPIVWTVFVKWFAFCFIG